jgi:acetoacetate decarboxylase
MKAPNFILKIIPHVDGSPRSANWCASSRGHRAEGGQTGPRRTGAFPHALADVARLPVREVLGAAFGADLTLGLGTVAFDYMKK